MQLYGLLLGALFVSLVHGVPSKRPSSVLLEYGSPYVHLNGRWDNTDTSWWGGTGFKVVASNLEAMTVHLGNLTTVPHAAVGVSVNYAAWQTVNLTAGANYIPLGDVSSSRHSQTVVRLATEGYNSNNLQLQAVELNAGATPKLYRPSQLNFQFIGDSLSAGVNAAQGEVQSWTFLTGEAFKAEHNIQAQPGICLTDMLCYGNEHGMSYEYFRAEDDGYFNDVNHNYTTPWNFRRDQIPSHVVIHIGANDASTAYNVTEASFESTYMTFFERLRVLYPVQPFFIFTPWGWPTATGINFYYTDPNPYVDLVNTRNALGDSRVYLVNTTGWVTWADVSPTNQHPTQAGEAKIATEFTAWLMNWGLEPEAEWATPAE